MEAELRKAPASYRMSMLSKVRNYKRDVEQLTADVVCCSLLHFITSVYVFYLQGCTSFKFLATFYHEARVEMKWVGTFVVGAELTVQSQQCRTMVHHTHVHSASTGLCWNRWVLKAARQLVTRLSHHVVNLSQKHVSSHSQLVIGEYSRKSAVIITSMPDRLHSETVRNTDVAVASTTVSASAIATLRVSRYQDTGSAMYWAAQRATSSTCDRCSCQLLCSSVNHWSSNYGTVTVNMHYETWKNTMLHTTWQVAACVVTQSLMTTRFLNATVKSSRDYGVMTLPCDELTSTHLEAYE